MAIHIHASSYRRNYLDPGPTSKDAYGPPPPRMTFDGSDNDPRTTQYLAERRAEIGSALYGSGLGGQYQGTPDITGGTRPRMTPVLLDAIKGNQVRDPGSLV